MVKQFNDWNIFKLKNIQQDTWLEELYTTKTEEWIKKSDPGEDWMSYKSK